MITTSGAGPDIVRFRPGLTPQPRGSGAGRAAGRFGYTARLRSAVDPAPAGGAAGRPRSRSGLSPDASGGHREVQDETVGAGVGACQRGSARELLDVDRARFQLVRELVG